MSKVVDLTGKIFGRLTVLERVGSHREPNGGTRALWLCRCSCGQEKIVQGHNLKMGRTRSCGCLRDETAAAILCRKQVEKKHPALKHGHSSSPTYSSFNAMKNRCFDPNAVNYPKYGGAGVSVCDRWLGKEGLQNFISDLGERPAGTSLGRKGDVGNYEPGNVAWMTPAEQVSNWRPDRNMGFIKIKPAEQIAA